MMRFQLSTLLVRVALVESSMPANNWHVLC